MVTLVRDLVAAAARRRRTRVWICLLGVIVAGLVVQKLYPQYAIPGLSSQPLPGYLVVTVMLLAFGCEFIDSSLGMGYGTTLTPVLLLMGFSPLQTVPCVLLSEFGTGLLAAAMHHHDGNIDLLRDRAARSTCIMLSVLSTVGAVLAVVVALSVSKFWFSTIIAIVIISMGATVLATANRRLKYRRGHIIAIGAVAAFNKGISGGGYGPLVCAGQVVSGISPKQAVAITSLAEAFTCMVALTAFVVMTGAPDWSLAAPLAIGAMMSVPLATLTVRRLPESLMRGAVGVASVALGVLALMKVLL